MIKSFLLITWRSMMKNKFYIFINILGLAVAIACTIVAYFNLEFDRSFDRTHVNRESIYRVSSVREFDNQATLYGFAPLPLGNVIRENISDVDKVVRLSWSSSNFKVDDDLFRAGLAYADSDFFEVFTFEMMAGSAAGMKDKSRIFLTDEMALKLFGTVNAVGRPLTQVMGQELKEYIVGGVFRKPPPNSSFIDFSAFTNYDNYFDEAKTVHEDDWRERSSLFVEITDAARVAAVRNSLQVYRENNNKVREDFQIREFVLDPFIGMAQRDDANDTWTQTRPANPRAAVIAPMIMAVLILLIACFNMTNTAIAISSRRLKEIGIRKVMGSMRGQLIAQFLGETTFVCTIALVLGLFLGEILLRAWNALWENMKLTSHYLDNPAFLLFIIGTLTFTALLAGGYPAFYVSRFRPAAILKGKLKFGGTNYFTRVLLALQYSISLIAVIFAIAFYGNSVYQANLDMGFNSKGVITAYVENQSEFETYRNALLANNDIISVAGSKHSIFSSRYNDPVKYQSKELEVDIMDVGDDYLKTMGMTLIEGRDFRRDSETDRQESIIVTKRFADSFGWDHALGKEILWNDTVKLYVIGVIKDVYTEGVWREMEPMMLRYTSPDKYTHVLVSGPLARLRDINEFMKEEWKKIFPNRLYNGWYISSGLTQAVTVSRNIVKIFAFMGVVALLLSVSGLFSLVSLNIIKKMKEIGVRKVLGASIANIMKIINTEFMVILGVSSVAGCVGSYFLVDILMASIWKYYQPATGMTFVISVFLMFACSAMAIGYKVFSAASMNPVNTLRDE
jgi:ABC-type lipoprotein release transport system permease subunit